MKPAQVFGIIVRLFGLSFFIYSLWYLVYGVATLLGLPEQHSGARVYCFINGVTFLVLSLYLLRGAPHILRFCYPDESKLEAKENAQPSAGGNAAPPRASA